MRQAELSQQATEARIPQGQAHAIRTSAGSGVAVLLLHRFFAMTANTLIGRFYVA